MLIPGVTQTPTTVLKSPRRTTAVAGNGSNLRSEDWKVDPQTERSALLKSIKARIRKGFYNSDAVMEDLSASFASVLDKLT